MSPFLCVQWYDSGEGQDLAQRGAGRVLQRDRVEAFWKSVGVILAVLSSRLCPLSGPPEPRTSHPLCLFYSFLKRDFVRGNHLTSLVLESGHHGRVACLGSWKHVRLAAEDLFSDLQVKGLLRFLSVVVILLFSLSYCLTMYITNYSLLPLFE